MDTILTPWNVLGLDDSYNKSDAIDAYNSLTLYYNNSSLSDKEKNNIQRQLDISIQRIINQYHSQDLSNKKFNQTFIKKLITN